MEELEAYYKFQIAKSKNTNVYNIIPLFKRGNNTVLNNLFEHSDDVRMVKTGPIGEMENYLSFNFKSKLYDRSQPTLSFQTIQLIIPNKVHHIPRHSAPVWFWL